MRAVVFTSNPSLESSVWWPIVRESSIEGVLICRRVVSLAPRAVARRFWRNVRRHGPLFVPYRLGVAAIRSIRRLRVDPAPRFETRRDEKTQVIEALNIHAPEVLDRVREWAPDVGISIGAPILRASLFRIPRLGTMNLHLGHVPDFRGAPPGFWELYSRASSIGATVHWVDEGLDTGDVIAAAQAPIYGDDTLDRVGARVEELGATVLRAALRDVRAGTATRTPQPKGGTTYRRPTLTQRIRLGARIGARRARSRVFRPRYVVKTVAALVVLYIYRPVRDVWRTLRRRHPVRVFTFHRVSNLCRDGMTVSPATFRRQVEFIARHHDVVSLGRGLEALRAGERLRRPLAVLTFDDGYESVFQHAWPVMRSAGVVGCCFLATGLVGTQRRFPHDRDNPVRDHLGVMSWDMINQLRADGWAAGGHTVNHPRMAACPREEWETELGQPVRELASLARECAPAFAYPFGGADDIVPEQVRLAEHLGYVACFSNFGGENVPKRDAFRLLRIDVGGDHAALAWRTLTHGIALSRLRPTRRPR